MKEFICVHVVAVNGEEQESDKLAYMVIDNDIVHAVSDEHNFDRGNASLMISYPGVSTPVVIEVEEPIEDVIAMVNNCRNGA